MKTQTKQFVNRALLGTLFILFGVQSQTAVAGQDTALPELVTIAPGTHMHRISGEFLKNGRPVDAPQKEHHFAQAFEIMKYQVSLTDYALCVSEGKCELPFRQSERTMYVDDNRPVTGVSYIDVRNYAEWLGTKTGVSWRLPTDAEWAYSAGSRYYDDATGIKTDPNDPSRQMLSKYKQSIDRNRDADPTIRPRGAFGANENGVYDQSGNVWEWTDTCYTRSKITDSGKIVVIDEGNCGVRVVEGRHRSYMTFFIQDAKSGGCAVGTPPDYLGFRLVKDNPPFFSFRGIRNWLGAKP